MTFQEERKNQFLAPLSTLRGDESYNFSYFSKLLLTVPESPGCSRLALSAHGAKFFPMQMLTGFHVHPDRQAYLFIHLKKMDVMTIKKPLRINQNLCISSSSVGVINRISLCCGCIYITSDLSRRGTLKITLRVMITACHVCTPSDLLFGWLSSFLVSILISCRVNRERRPTQFPSGSSQAVLLTVALTAREH